MLFACAAEGDDLRAADGVVGNGDCAGLRAGGRRRERHTDGAVGTSGDGSTAGVGLSVLRAGGNAGDAERSSARIGQCYGLGGAGGVEILIAEGQARWREADARASASTARSFVRRQDIYRRDGGAKRGMVVLRRGAAQHFVGRVRVLEICRALVAREFFCKARALGAHRNSAALADVQGPDK